MAKHMARCPGCGRLFEVDRAVREAVACPACEAALAGGKARPPPSRDPLLGKRLGEFEILAPIGHGGMGSVYKGRQTSLGRLVAIKTLPFTLAANADFVDRFHREARTAGQLRHPNLVQVYAVGEAEGTHYIAMEYVDGETLSALLRREGPLAPGRALQILTEVCSALAAAHDAGIVHRDVKPSNIMIDSAGSARLADFGLAKHAEGDVSLTVTGTALGTPLYMAPEVAAGRAADARSDLYSLGASFFHLLAGRPPFLGQSFSELILQHANESPPALGELAPHVEPRFAATIDRLLRKDPAERFPSVRALLEALEALGPLQAGAPPLPQVLDVMGKTTRTAAATLERGVRDWAGTALAAGAVCALLGTVGLVAWASRRGTEAPLDTPGHATRPASVAVPKHGEGPPGIKPPELPSARISSQAVVAPVNPLVARAALVGLEPGLVMAFYDGFRHQRFVKATVATGVAFDWNVAAPLEGVPEDFSTRIVGWLWVQEDGQCEFAFWADDGARLYLDGRLVLDAWEWDRREDHGKASLAAGWHRLWIEHVDRGAAAAVKLSWLSGGKMQAVDSRLLFCERELIERVRRDPTDNVLAGLRPDEPVRRPGAAEVEPRPLAAPPGDLGPMAARAVEPFEALFKKGEALDPWEIEAGEWMLDGDSLLVSAETNGWLALKNRALGDFVLEADVTDTGQHVGFCYGLIFRRIGGWHFLLGLSTEYKEASLRTVTEYTLQPGGFVPGVIVRPGQRCLEPKAGQTYHLKVECVGTRVRGYVDGELLGEAEDRALLGGGVALYVHRAIVRFANVRIRPPAEPPPNPPEALARLWWGRAESVDAEPQLSPREKLKAWEDVLERCPKAAPQSLARATQQRDHWARVVAETHGAVTERSKRYEQEVFHTAVRQLADGRFRFVYEPARGREYLDWETVVGYAHVSDYQTFCLCRTRHPLSAFRWRHGHGEDFKVRFTARAARTYGCTIFGAPSGPPDAGLVLAIGAEENRATTLGPAGQPPWFRSDVVPTSRWQEHELEVAKSELIYRFSGKEAFHRKIDLSAFPGRQLLFWARSLPIDEQKTPRFCDVHIVAAEQADWVATEPE